MMITHKSQNVNTQLWFEAWPTTMTDSAIEERQHPSLVASSSRLIKMASLLSVLGARVVLEDLKNLLLVYKVPLHFLTSSCFPGPFAMDHLISFSAILFPSDGRPPSLVQLMTSPMTVTNHHAFYTTSPSRMPHPEVFMDYIAEGLGSRAWKFQLVEALDGMNRKFANPYIIFYPTVSRDGMSFHINKSIREIQGRAFKEECAWRGNIVIAKYCDNPFSSMIDASMADFPILKNYLLTHGAPKQV